MGSVNCYSHFDKNNNKYTLSNFIHNIQVSFNDVIKQNVVELSHSCRKGPQDTNDFDIC